MYYVTAVDPVSDMAVSYKFYVPELPEGLTSVRLQDIIVDGPVSTTPYDEAALLVIHGVKTSVTAARDTVLQAAQDLHDVIDEAEAAAQEAFKALPTTSPTPPASPVNGQQWISTVTGRKYHWLASESAWAEMEASLVVTAPEAAEGATGFSPGTLQQVATINPATTSLLVEVNGVAQRINIDTFGVTPNELPSLVSFSPTDIITVMQVDGIEKKATFAQLATGLHAYLVAQGLL
jgi:hypothetical protein